MDFGKEFKKYATKHLGINTLKVEQHEKLINTPYNMTPYIIEERQLNVTQLDVYSRMLMDRILFFNQQVNSETMGLLIAQTLFLESVDPVNDIKLMINSGGGDVISGMGLYDTFMTMKPDLETTVIGMAASMGSILSSSGTKGKRYMLKHSRFMIHDIRGGSDGTFEDMKRSLDLSEKLRDELFQVLANNSGNSHSKIKEWCDRDYWMKSDESVEKGFADHIIEHRR